LDNDPGRRSKNGANGNDFAMPLQAKRLDFTALSAGSRVLIKRKTHAVFRLKKMPGMHSIRALRIPNPHFRRG
jgi:hypothetical protein